MVWWLAKGSSKMIKKGIVLLIFLLLMVPVMADSVLVEIDGFTNVRIESLRMSPSTIGPGENFDLYLSIETERKSSSSTMNTLDDVEIELVEGVFTLQAGEDAVQELGTMLQGQQTTIKYSLKVDMMQLRG